MLVQYFAMLATQSPVNLKIINSLVRPLIDMSTETPYFAAICARQRIIQIRTRFCDDLKIPGLFMFLFIQFCCLYFEIVVGLCTVSLNIWYLYLYREEWVAKLENSNADETMVIDISVHWFSSPGDDTDASSHLWVPDALSDWVLSWFGCWLFLVLHASICKSLLGFVLY